MALERSEEFWFRHFLILVVKQASRDGWEDLGGGGLLRCENKPQLGREAFLLSTAGWDAPQRVPLRVAGAGTVAAALSSDGRREGPAAPAALTRPGAVSTGAAAARTAGLRRRKTIRRAPAAR
jgi:hypothetical protein